MKQHCKIKQLSLDATPSIGASAERQRTDGSKLMAIPCRKNVFGLAVTLTLDL